MKLGSLLAGQEHADEALGSPFDVRPDLPEGPSCGLSCLGSFVPAGWFARHVPRYRLLVAGIKLALQICQDVLSTQQTYGCVTVAS